MSQTLVPVQTISETAAALTYHACDTGNGNKVANPNGDIFLALTNTDETNSASVVVTAQGASHNVPGYGPMTKANLTVALAAGDEKVLGPFSKAAWNDVNDNIILAISGSGAASVNIAALKLSIY